MSADNHFSGSAWAPQSAYEEGRQARREELALTACPYGVEAAAFRASWLEGWRDSDAILRALAPFQAGE